MSAASEKVWGAAYHIPGEHAEAVRSYLDIREINGYSIRYTTFFPSDLPFPEINSAVPVPKPITCLVYIGLPDNPQFLGPQDPQVLAKHILQSSGPSGPNREYLYMLGEALDALSADSGDEHIRDLVQRCRALEADGEGDFGLQKNVDGHEDTFIGQQAKIEMEES